MSAAGGAEAPLHFAVADRRFGVREGLPGPQVLTVHEGRDGSIWAGTVGGLARLGGGQVEVWTAADGLPAVLVYSVLELADGTLLVGTARGIARREGARFVAEDAPDGRVRTLARTPSGDVLALVGDHTVVRRTGPGRWSTLEVRGPAGARGLALAVDGAGDLWLATRDHGLLRYRRDASRERLDLVESRGPAQGFPGGQASFVTPYGEGVAALADDAIWIFGPRGARRIPSSVSLHFGSAAAAPDGRLYVGLEDGGVHEVRDGGPRRLESREGLARAGTVRLLVDAAGNVWVGTVDRGLVALLTGSRVRYLRSGPADAASLGRDPAGAVWVGVERDVYRFRLDGQGDPTEVVRVANLRDHGRFYAIHSDSDGGLVFATGGGVARAPAGRWQGPNPALERDSRFPELDGVVYMARGPRGHLWALGSQGLFRLSPGTARSERIEPGTHQFGRAMTVDAAGVAWLGSRGGGLLRVGEDRQVARVLPDGARVQHVVRDPEGHVIVAIEDGGWTRFEAGTGRVRARQERGQPLARLSPLSLVPTGEGRFLGAVGEGRFGPLSLEPPQAGEAVLSASELDEADFRWLVVEPDGASGLWLATMGQVAHRPREVRLPPARALRMAAVLGDAGPLDPRAPHLPPRPNGLTALLELADPLSRRVRYRWRLLPERESFTPWSADPTVRLTNLDPRSFTLEAEALDRWGRPAAGGPLRLAVSAAPRSFETGPFRLAAAVALFAAAALAYRLRVRSLVAERAHLERAVADRSAALAARNLELQQANLRLEAAQAQIARLGERGSEAVHDMAAWARAVGSDVAGAVGARAVEAFEASADGSLQPLATEAAAAPTLPDVQAALGAGGFRSDGPEAVIVARGISGETYGAVRVRGKASWTPTERRVLASFAQQLGGALELRRMRRNLAAAEARREADRREMLDAGVELLRLCPTCGRCYGGEDSACAADGSALEDRTLLPRDVASRYRLLRVLGRGGMGLVFEALDLRLAREVAVKILREDGLTAAAGRARLTHEARVVAQVDHPNVVAVHDSGELPGGATFVVMERLRGVDLSAVLMHAGPGSPRQVAELLRQGAAGLAAAHGHGLVHRDVKPANVFLVPAGPVFRVKIVDFGIAKSLGDHDVRLTQTGAILGTPAYMAPEQALGQTVGPRTDAYSFGVVAFEALTGRRPFAAAELPDLLHAVVYEPPPPVSRLRGGLPRAVDDLFGHVLAKDPEERPSSLVDWAAGVAVLLETVPSEGGWPPLSTVVPGETVPAVPPTDLDPTR